MINLYFRKILEYDPTFAGKFSKYGGYSLITSQKRSPNILAIQKYELDIPNNVSFPVLSSSMKRGTETAYKNFDKKNVLSFEELNEVKFDLTALLSIEEYQEEGSTLVRKRFIEAFIQDSLTEKRDEIKTRMDFLIKTFSSFEEGNYLVISHSFFMKIFQTYLYNADLFTQPALLKNYFDSNSKTFEFGKGFNVLLTK